MITILWKDVWTLSHEFRSCSKPYNVFSMSLSNLDFYSDTHDPNVMAINTREATMGSSWLELHLVFLNEHLSPAQPCRVVPIWWVRIRPRVVQLTSQPGLRPRSAHLLLHYRKPAQLREALAPPSRVQKSLLALLLGWFGGASGLGHSGIWPLPGSEAREQGFFRSALFSSAHPQRGQTTMALPLPSVFAPTSGHFKP